MNTANLFTPILEGGIYNTNFFNGRLLTAEDLGLEQEANRKQHMRLGQAVGEGVVFGMEVSVFSDGSDGTPPVVHVTKGIALNGRGKAIELPEDTRVALFQEEEQVIPGTGLFAECETTEAQGAPAGTHVYVLTVAPASGYEGMAPARGLNINGKTAGCRRRYAVEGVCFRLLRLDTASSVLDGLSQARRNELASLMNNGKDEASLSRIRNILDHACLGTEEKVRSVTGPFNLPLGEGYGVIERMRLLQVAAYCDVPLALIYWGDGGVKFTDMWSVRRRPVPKPVSGRWPAGLSERYEAEAEAAFLAFQSQAGDLISKSQTAPGSVRMRDYFSFLPAAGYIPILGFNGTSGFNYIQFFSGCTYRDPVFIEGARLGVIMRESFGYPPIDLNKEEMLWLYLVHENMESVESPGVNPPQPYIIFTTAQMPFHGEARYHANYWNYANYV